MLKSKPLILVYNAVEKICMLVRPYKLTLSFVKIFSDLKLCTPQFMVRANLWTKPVFCKAQDVPFVLHEMDKEHNCYEFVYAGNTK